MRKLWTKESFPPELPLLGRLLAVENGSRAVSLCQRIVIPDAGHFVEQKRIASLTRSEMDQWQAAHGRTFQEENCLGVVPAKELSVPPVGALQLIDGYYTYCLPVYRAKDVGNAYKPRGYLPLEDGRFVVVAFRRHIGCLVAIAVVLALLVAAAVLCFTYGPQTVWDTLKEFVLSLFQAQ